MYGATDELSTMRNQRVVVSKFGGPECLHVIDEEASTPGNGKVRVRVLAAGVSFADLLMREGVHPERKHPPFTLGWHLIGQVDRFGKEVQGLQEGDTVAALTITGDYARYICLPATELVRVPPDVDAAAAVCLVMDYMVAYQMLHRSVRLQSGDRVLIHGASGGCGTALLQLGSLMGLRMFGTASSSKLDYVRALGGEPIDYRNDDFVQVVQNAGKVKAVFESVGGVNLFHSYRCLQRPGMLVFYGMTAVLRQGRRSWLGTASTLFSLGMALALGVVPIGGRVVLYSIQRRKRQHPEDYRQDLTELFYLLRDEKIAPMVAKRFSLEDAAQAHEFMANKTVPGKVVLLVPFSDFSQPSC